jgi:hypothetical protein
MKGFVFSHGALTDPTGRRCENGVDGIVRDDLIASAQQVYGTVSSIYNPIAMTFMLATLPRISPQMILSWYGW